MDSATVPTGKQLLMWVVWGIVVLVSLLGASRSTVTFTEPPASVLAVNTKREDRWKLFPWLPRWRWKKSALREYRRWKESYQRARRNARMARLLLQGAVPLARIVEGLTLRQVHYQLGALPVLYALLETLQVRQIINRHCPTRREVDHGTIALVLVLNRLMFPLPIYRVADWVGRTVLESMLGIDASKFNDDRIGRTLDALAPNLEAIWLEVSAVALRQAQVDLSVVFYDLTAFIVHGRYEKSKLMDFGFAHNTPSNKRKFKLALNTLKDGNIPGLWQIWKGRTADQATVQQNMDNLSRWLHMNRRSLSDTLVVGDRAMLSAKIAVTYDQLNLRYLSGLRPATKEQKELLPIWDDETFEKHPIVSGENPQYWGRSCRVRFEYDGRRATHKGLVVLSGPLRDQFRKSREEKLEALEKKLSALRESIGKPRLRSKKAVQRKAETILRNSPVGKLVKVEVQESAMGEINLHWEIDEAALRKAERLDGRYLLVTNDWSLSPQKMFRLYREKDGGEKRFLISKSDIRVSPIYLHRDDRVSSMMLLNMIALLGYSILERQVKAQGLSLTSRQIIQRLQNLTLIETSFLDGSKMRRITPITPEVRIILVLVSEALDDLIAWKMPSRETILLLPNAVESSLSPPSLE